MTDSNRLRLTHVREVTLGTTPGTPRMRTARLTGETLEYTPEFVDSEELRDDRMNEDPIKVGERNAGPVNFEFAFPPDNSPESDWLESAFFAEWALAAVRDNDGTSDSVITDVADTTDVVTCATGTAFVAGQIARFTGFTAAANNGVFKCTTGSATVPAFLGANFVAEAAPPAAARIKVVGFQGASGDLNATADGISSSALDFTTLGLSVGQWIKIGGTATADKFVTTALNGWARIAAIAQNLLTLDNKPTGWTTETGTSLTVKVWFGDQLKNGTTMLGQTLERRFMGQDTPTSVIQRGMVVDQLQLQMQRKQRITGSSTFLGMSGEVNNTSLDASPDARSTGRVMAGSVNVARVSDDGAAVAGPNYSQSFSLTIRNNLRDKGDLTQIPLIGIGAGDQVVEGELSTYFGSKALMDKLLAGGTGSLASILQKDSQAIVLQLPRITRMGGAASATAKNQDVMLPLRVKASKDTTTGAQVILDRLEYYEA